MPVQWYLLTVNKVGLPALALAVVAVSAGCSSSALSSARPATLPPRSAVTATGDPGAQLATSAQAEASRAAQAAAVQKLAAARVVASQAAVKRAAEQAAAKAAASGAAKAAADKLAAARAATAKTGCGQRAVTVGKFDPSCAEYQGYLDPGTAAGRAPTSGEIQHAYGCQQGYISRSECTQRELATGKP